MARRDLTGAVNFGHLESYAGNDQAIVDEVLAIFREQAAMWIRLLDPAADGDAWRDAAHTLKGSARAVGAMALGEACEAAERAAEAGMVERARLVETVRGALDLALADIAAYTHEQALRSLRSPRAPDKRWN